ILRPEGRLYFLNAQFVADHIKELVAQHKPRVLVLDMSRVPDIEYSALQAMMEGANRAAAEHQEVWLAALNPGALEVVRHCGLDQPLVRERMLFNARIGMDRYHALKVGKGAVLNRVAR